MTNSCLAPDKRNFRESQIPLFDKTECDYVPVFIALFVWLFPADALRKNPVFSRENGRISPPVQPLF
jgi:hypothetical protein